MSDAIKNAIFSAKNGDAVEFKDSIHAALSDKIAQAIQMKKIEYSTHIFSKDSESAGVESTEV